MTRHHSSRASTSSALDAGRKAPELAPYDLCGLSSPGAVTATLVREARRSAGVSMAELGRRTGVPEQIVALWEDPTWEGHSLNVLQRVAKALELRLELRFAPSRQRQNVSVEEPVAA
jgi:DNA-binding transcriptional regulator YiaG